MTAKIWEHWYKWYLTFKDEEGNAIKTEWFETEEEAKCEAKRWGAFIVR